MSVMIPDSCPAKASAGEKRLFRLFQDLLPDSFTVWYEPIVKGRYPDFIVLADIFGLLVLEVKGWYAKDVTKATDTDVELTVVEDGQSFVKTMPHPLRQARDYMFTLMDQLALQPLLRNASGDHQGRLSFPCGFGVLLTNITREQLQIAGLNEIFPQGPVLCRDELTALETTRSDQETLRRFRQMFAPDFPFDPLTEDQLKTIQGVIHKEVQVKTRLADQQSIPEGQALPENATVLEVLDARQQQLARTIGEGHRVFFGVAGSGKTVLLVARAKLIASENPTRKILILCFNRVLGSAIKATFAADPAYRNVGVLTFHAWARDRTGVTRYAGEEVQDYFRRLESSMMHAAHNWSEAQKYDAILIDEGHDFEPEWFSVCVQALKGGQEGDLLIAVDGAQSVYGRPRAFTWKSVGVNAQGRTRHLSTNYRNTREVLALAWEVAQADRVGGEGDDEALVRVQPTEATRSGPLPSHRGCTTAAEEQAVIAGLVRRFKDMGIADRDIAVLYARREGTRMAGLVQALKRTEEVCWLSDPDNSLIRDRWMTAPGVRVSTIHSAKGLEFSAVIVCAADQLPGPHQDDPASDANLLYVGLTRALEHLVVTWVGRSAFTDRIVGSGKARPWSNP